jgi:hypothetical protein
MKLFDGQVHMRAVEKQQVASKILTERLRLKLIAVPGGFTIKYYIHGFQQRE